MEMAKKTAVFTFKNVDQLINDFSQPFEFRDIQWRIQIQRSGNYYRVFLHSGNEDSSSQWSIVASIAFRLLPFSFGRYPAPKCYERSLGAFQFSTKRLNCGISNFITVDDLNDPKKQLVQNNTINFEVEINANHDEIVVNKRPPQELDLPIDIAEKRYNFRISDISEVIAMVSMPFNIADIPWQLVVSKYKTGDTQSLGCHLSIDQQKFKANESFTCDVSVQYELQSQKGIVIYSVLSDFHNMNASNSYSMPLKHLVTLNELFDEKNGFVNDDSIQLEGHFKVKLPNNALMKKRPKIKCPVCLDNILDSTMFSTECGHIYCEKCIVNPVKTKKKCVICSRLVSTNKIHPIYFP